MKPSPEWTEEDIEGLIRDQVEESIELDYKACDSLAKTDGKKNEISKDVSAFANSAGGTIVYGVLENGHVPVAIDTGYDPREITKEWLEQIINSRIHRRIDGAHINPVKLGSPRADKVLYVVTIPQSLRAPHMAADHRYYKRFNFESVPMEDYEVRDVMQRAEVPDLYIEFRLNGAAASPIQFTDGADQSEEITLDMSITNHSTTPAEYVVVHVCIDTRLRVKSAGSMSVNSRVNQQVGSVQLPVDLLTFNWGIPGKLPIWQGMQFRLLKAPVRLSIPRQSGDYYTSWSIRSPRMPERSRVYVIKFDGNTATLGQVVTG